MESTLVKELKTTFALQTQLLQGKISTRSKKEAQEQEGDPKDQETLVCLVFIMALVQCKAFV